MAYDAVQALQGFYGIKEDAAALDPAAGLVPLTSSLIPPLVAQAFGLPTFGGAQPVQHQPTLGPQQHAQSLYGSMTNPALMGAFGFGGAQFAAAIQQQSQLATGLPLGYLQAFAAASQHHQQQQQQQQQQQHNAAAILAQTAGALHAHTAALAAAARAAPATSSAISQPLMPAFSQDVTTASAPQHDQDRTTTNTTATTSSVPKTGLGATIRPVASMPFQNPLMMQNLYAAFSQPQATYAQTASPVFGAAVPPYGAVHSAYYARPPDANAAAVAAAAAAAAAATGAYGYSPAPSAVTYGSSFHPGYGGNPLDYSAALAAAYRPVAAPVAPSPSCNPQQSQSAAEEDYTDDGSTRAIKRPRLVWTPQLHKKFESAVQKLGVEKAVPKNIMQEMNIDGLTRENVASHLQKYRMLRRKDVTSSEGRDSDSRTQGTKRSEPESCRPVLTATQTTSTVGGGSGRGAGGGAPSALTDPTSGVVCCAGVTA